MKFTIEEIEVHKFTLENFILKRKPPAEFENLLKHEFKIKDNKIIIETIRFDNNIKRTTEIAKILLEERPNTWQLYWKRYNEKWEKYDSERPLITLSTCLKVIHDDISGCFFG